MAIRTTPTPFEGQVVDLELHKAAFTGNLELLVKLLDAGTHDINGFDKHGNTPLVLALHFKHPQIVGELLQRGADCTLKSKAGWSPIRCALSSGVTDQVRLIHVANLRRDASSVLQRIPSMIQALKSLPDFYTELKWEFSSWVPFVTRFCPSDTYKIWKKGGNFRVDMTLIGYENMKWLRGRLSIIFKENSSGSERPGDVFIVDYAHERFESALDVQSEPVTPSQIEREIQELYSMPLVTTQASTVQTRFDPVLSWRGNPKEETVHGYKCKILSMDGFIFRSLQRQLKDGPPYEFGHPIDHSVGDDLTMSWSQYEQEPAAPGGKVPLLYKNENCSCKEKTFKGTVWITSQFARKPTDFLPIFECMLLSNQPKRFEKLAEFVRMKMPEDGFPVKVELPVFPTITGQASFLVYEEKQPNEINDDLFTVPTTFRQVTELNPKQREDKPKK